jgi:saccharopine dehydrogenase-like NADP-dependent oxidoreductase
MKTVAVVGAGRVGLSCAKILSKVSQLPVIVVDASEKALEKAKAELPGAVASVANGRDDLLAAFRRHSVETVVCATPFSANLEVAQAAFSAGANYLDFTEDVSVAAQIKGLSPTHVSAVSQTGLAPGLITYIGLSLFRDGAKPSSLALRVGALPLASLGPGHYAITWSPEGLVNEYLRPALRKVNGSIESIQPLQWHHREQLILDGVTYEAFPTSGGVGDLDAYSSIPSVEYKTLRYPGHLDFIKPFIEGNSSFEQKVEKIKSLFPTTRDDLVVMAALAQDADGHCSAFTKVVHSNRELNMTALELTTAGTGAAVAELLSRQLLPKGFVTADKIKLQALQQTKAYQLIQQQM